MVLFRERATSVQHSTMRAVPPANQFPFLYISAILSTPASRPECYRAILPPPPLRSGTSIDSSGTLVEQRTPARPGAKIHPSGPSSRLRGSRREQCRRSDSALVRPLAARRRGTPPWKANDHPSVHIGYIERVGSIAGAPRRKCILVQGRRRYSCQAMCRRHCPFAKDVSTGTFRRSRPRHPAGGRQ